MWTFGDESFNWSLRSQNYYQTNTSSLINIHSAGEKSEYLDLIRGGISFGTNNVKQALPGVADQTWAILRRTFVLPIAQPYSYGVFGSFQAIHWQHLHCISLNLSGQILRSSEGFRLIFSVFVLLRPHLLLSLSCLTWHYPVRHPDNPRNSFFPQCSWAVQEEAEKIHIVSV